MPEISQAKLERFEAIERDAGEVSRIFDSPNEPGTGRALNDLRDALKPISLRPTCEELAAFYARQNGSVDKKLATNNLHLMACLRKEFIDATGKTGAAETVLYKILIDWESRYKEEYEALDKADKERF